MSRWLYDLKSQRFVSRPTIGAVALNKVGPMDSGKLVGRVSSGSGSAEQLTPAQVKTLLDIVGVTTAALAAKASTSDIDSAVAAAISVIIDSSPATLDTLNELAAALGDDPNFATTMSTALGNKQALAANLTAIAALATTNGSAIVGTGSAFGLQALGQAAAKNVGTGSGDVAAGDKGLPSVGANGQVLTVVSGAWASAAASGGGGSAYSSALLKMSWSRNDASTLARSGAISNIFSDISGLSVGAGLSSAITLPAGTYKIRLDNCLINSGRLNYIIGLVNSSGSGLYSGGTITNLVSCVRAIPNAKYSTGAASSSNDCYQVQVFYLQLSGSSTFYIATDGFGSSTLIYGVSFTTTPSPGSFLDIAIDIMKMA